MAGVLRAIAIAIAVAAAIDPRLAITARARQRIAVQVDPAASIPAAARAADDRLRDALIPDFEVISGADTAAAALVVIGSSYPDTVPAAGQRVFTVTTLPSPTEPDVRIARLRMPADVPRGTLIHVEAEVDAANLKGAASTLTVRAGRSRVEVARATHTWTKPTERWLASMDVTPIGSPPWLFHVDVSAASGERSVNDNAADDVVRESDALRILVYEPRPSWPGTFVRRALEGDARFEVGGVSYPSRGVQVTTGGTRSLQAIALDAVTAIVVGGVDQLTRADAATLERFMREREGAVILLPDSRNDLRVASQWLSIPAATEVLLEKPAALSAAAPLPDFAASEMLTFEAPPGLRTLARATGSNQPVVVETPYGPGRLLISGALDAWRYRVDDRAAFDRFWQASIAGAAAMARPPVAVRIASAVVNVGDDATVHVQVRRAALGLAPSEPLRVSAVANGTEPVRLWPDAAADTFVGTFSVPRVEGIARIAVSVDAAPAVPVQAMAVVARAVRIARPTGAPLSLLAQSRGGVNVAAEHVDELARRLRQDIASPATRVERRPMRSAWWMLPFTACLAGEWWLRRRRGLR